jgi:hypothetical protein
VPRSRLVCIIACRERGDCTIRRRNLKHSQKPFPFQWQKVEKLSVFYLKLISTLQVYPYFTRNPIRLRYEPNRLMLSIGLWRRYITVTITIADIIYRPVFYLKHNLSETAFCLRLQVEPVRRQKLALSIGSNWTGSTVITQAANVTFICNNKESRLPSRPVFRIFVT